MSPSFNSFGSNPSVSQLVWDTDLVIPAGKAIESASGEVVINSDGSITADGNITSLTNLVGVNAVISGKQLLTLDNLGYVSVALSQIPSENGNYTSDDFAITGAERIENAPYIAPPITFSIDTPETSGNCTFSLQAKLANGSYQTISSVTLNASNGPISGTTQSGIIPPGATALRYELQTFIIFTSRKISSDLVLPLTPAPVYWKYT